MAMSPRPSTPPTDPAPPADTQTLVDAGLMPEQPVPSSDPPVDDPPSGDQPADNT